MRRGFKNMHQQRVGIKRNRCNKRIQFRRRVTVLRKDKSPKSLMCKNNYNILQCVTRN